MSADRHILDLFGIELPVIQAPMAGVQNCELAMAVTGGGALGSLPAAMLSPTDLRSELSRLSASGLVRSGRHSDGGQRDACGEERCELHSNISPLPSIRSG